MNEQRPRRIVKDLPVTRLLPNMLTLLSLCSGMTGIRYALHEQWDYAVLAVMIATVFDVLDGRVARMLNIASKFGAELDSLSDAVSFGVAPAFIIYQWTLKDAGGIGWIATLIFAVCGVLRLARFNTMLDDHDVPKWSKGYFTGVPIPSGAALAMWPLAIVIEFGAEAQLAPVWYAFWLIIVGGLMVSRLPTIAIKGWRIAPVWVAPLFICLVALVAGLITDTWFTLSLAGAVYVLLLPISFTSYALRAKKEGYNG